MEWYLGVFKKYAEFSGRARRTEYWMFILFNIIATVILNIVDFALGMSLLSIIYALVVLIPSLAVSVRRMHDTGRSGWWILVGLVPLVGWIILLYFTVQNGHQGSNEYGDDPKASVTA